MKPYLLILCLLLGACTGLPKAMKDAQVVDVTHAQAIQSIDAHKDASVRWGGVIIDVENDKNFTLIQILIYPLSYLGRPHTARPNGGRFVIRSKEFLDPLVYAKEKEITVVGTLSGYIVRKVGKKIILVPLVQSTAIHLWPNDYHNDDYLHGH